jgi:integrase/recombinase XerD
MSALAPTLEAYFTERLIGQRRASPNTVAAYRDAWRLLLGYAHTRIGKEPSSLEIADLDASLIAGFLDHLESERHNSVRTRNARLAAIRSFFRYAALRHPEHANLIARVLDVPAKRTDRKDVTYLNEAEVDALLSAPDRETWLGRRDHAMLAVAVQTGLRVSELVGLSNRDVEVGTGAHVRCFGKGRKERCTPLDPSTVQILRAWVAERGGEPEDPLFPARPGSRLTRNAVSCLLRKHVASMEESCPSLSSKRPSPHSLRHYVDACVMWPAGVFPLAGLPGVPVPAT